MLPIQPKSTQNASSAGKNGSVRASSARSGQFVVPQDVPHTSEHAQVNGAANIAQLGGVNALFLQEVDTPTERRRRQAKNGQQLLDTLDAVKADVLVDGYSGAGNLMRLKTQLDDLDLAEVQDDPQLYNVLDQINLRVQVELAKRGLL